MMIRSLVVILLWVMLCFSLDLSFALTTGRLVVSDFIYDQYAASRYYYDSQLNLVLEQRNFSNNKVPSVPRHNVSFSLKYEKKFYPWISHYSQIGYWGVSGMYVDDANSEKTNNYIVMDFSLGVDVTLGPLNLILAGGIHNLFDDSYVGFININSASGQFYESGAPRNYFSSAKLNLQL